MKILVANYRYFVSGGPERYLFSLKAGLEQAGHEVVPFSIAYAGSEPTPWSRFFVPPPGRPDEVYFQQQSRDVRTMARTLERSFFSPGVERAVIELCREAKPDVAYVLHYLKKLSPAVLTGLKKSGVPIVVRLSDFLLVCANAHLLRDGRVCTDCVKGSRWNSVRHRCVQGSLGASMVHWLATSWHHARGYFDLIDRFVVPSRHTIELMVEAGWPEEKFIYLPTFTDPEFFGHAPQAGARDGGFVFSGHLEEHKGIWVLLEAYAQAAASCPDLPVLHLFARKDGPAYARVEAFLRERGLAEKVLVEGFLDRKSVAAAYRAAVATIVPSTCFENMPNAIIESFASGTPVLAANHGSMAPLVRDGETGLLTAPGDVSALAEALLRVAKNPEWVRSAGLAARFEAERFYTRDAHLEKLMTVFGGLAESLATGV